MAGIDPEQQSRLFKMTVSYAAKKLAENPDFIEKLAAEIVKQDNAVAAVAKVGE